LKDVGKLGMDGEDRRVGQSRHVRSIVRFANIGESRARQAIGQRPGSLAFDPPGRDP
jgi:hypothetical protein